MNIDATDQGHRYDWLVMWQSRPWIKRTVMKLHYLLRSTFTFAGFIDAAAVVATQQQASIPRFGSCLCGRISVHWSDANATNCGRQSHRPNLRLGLFGRRKPDFQVDSLHCYPDLDWFTSISHRTSRENEPTTCQRASLSSNRRVLRKPKSKQQFYTCTNTCTCRKWVWCSFPCSKGDILYFDDWKRRGEEAF